MDYCFKLITTARTRRTERAKQRIVLFVAFRNKKPYKEILINLDFSVFTKISNFNLDAWTSLSFGQYSN